MRVLLFCLILCMTGCGWFSRGSDYPEGEVTDNPVQIIDDNTLVYYDPKVFIEGVPHEEMAVEGVKVCSYDYVNYVTDPFNIDDEFIEFIYDTRSGDRSYSIGDDLLDAEHLYVQDMKLVLNRSNFDFLVWIKADIKGNDLERRRVAWGGPFDPGARSIDLDVKGDVDFRPYLTDEIDFGYTYRAKSPDLAVKMTVDINYIRLYGCEEAK